MGFGHVLDLGMNSGLLVDWSLFFIDRTHQAIVGSSVLVWYVTKNNPSDGTPAAVGGKDNEQPVPTSTTPSVVGNLGGSTRFHVSPTLTIANRAREPLFTGAVNISGL